MRRQPHPVVSPTGGLDVSLDPVFLTDQKSPNLREVYYHKGIVKKEFGFLTFSDTLADRPMAFANYKQLDGTEYLVCLTVDDAQEYDTTNDEWDLIANSDNFTGDEDDRFDWTVMNDLLITTNGKDAIYKWDGTTWAVLGDLAAIQAKLVSQFYTYCILGHTIESGTTCPHRIRWSDTADPEDWTSGLFGFFDINDTQDQIVQLAMLGDRIFVFKEESIWEIYHVGGTDVFKYRNVIMGTGTRCPGSVVHIRGVLVFLGDDDFYSFDGSYVTPIGQDITALVTESQTKIVNTSKLNRAPGVYDVATHNYVVVLPTESDEPDLVLKWDVRNKVWTRRDKQNVPCLGLDRATDRTTWDSAVGTWDGGSWDIPWDRLSLPPGTPQVLYGLDTGVTHKDDRATKSTNRLVWESKDFLFGHASRITGVSIQAKGDPFDLGYSLDGGVTWSGDDTLTPDVTEFKELFQGYNLTTQKIRFRIRTSNETLEVKWIEPWHIQRKRSKSVN